MRPRDWSPLADHDPVPGDPAEALRAARHLRNIADEVDRQAAELRALSGTDGMTSEAVDALQAAAAAVAARLSRVPGRYRAAAGALTEWAAALDDAQGLAGRALSLAQRAQESRCSGPPEAAPPDPADDELRLARGLLAEAVELRDRAERRAVTAVDCARHADGLEDRPFAGLRAALHAASHGLASAASWVTDLHHLAAVCSWVSTVSGVLSLVFALVPGLGEVLALTSLVSGVLAMLADAALAARGEGSAGTVVADVVGIALGRVGGKGLMGAVAGVRTETARVTAAAAESSVRAAAAPRVAAAMRTLRRPGAGAQARARARSILDDVETAVAAERASAAQAALVRDLPRLRRGDLRLLVGAGGDVDAARAAKLARAAAVAHPADTAVVLAAAHAAARVRRVALARVIGTGYDLWGKVPAATGAGMRAVRPRRRHRPDRALHAAVAW